MHAITPKALKEMFISGANNLYNHYPEVDQLNVFPIPDGDTGMNMNLTVSTGVKEIQNYPEMANLYEIASGFSHGLLMGARGNSGVITSQIFKGFSLPLQSKKTLNAKDLADAFVSAKEVAYKAVLKPVEGTILTVIRESSDALKKYVASKPNASIEACMDYLLEQAKISLEHTPELLPVLKEVGVVDSGGAGLVRILEGMVSAAHGTVVAKNTDVGIAPAPETNLYAGAKLTEDEDESYGYCTQFILRLGKPGENGKKPFIERNFLNYLARHGKSLVTVRDDDIVKVHVHTLTPGNTLNYAQQFGEFVSITIENMSEEHNNISHGLTATDMAGNIAAAKKQAAESKEGEESEQIAIVENSDPDKEYALIAVSSGAGLDEMFRELSVDEIVSGGQTMNPSTEDFVNAVKHSHARNVFILPNNSNIILAASQASDVMRESGINVQVIPTKTIPQGLTAAMNYNPDQDPEAIFADMSGAINNVKSGSVTYAIKDTEISGLPITKGFYMAMKDHNIVSCVKDKTRALQDLLGALVDDDAAVVTVLVGEDITAEEEEKITAELTEKYGEQCEVDVKRGDQPVYSYLVGVE
ncbi:MAG: DAK2 domain-containing protein [Bacilli bacterium]|nr:DAK2 domain-containing protein [Bacilli bacterium]